LKESHPVFHWTLLPLSEGATARFAAQLTGSVETANEFLSALMRITQGNPLYVREFVTAVKRRGNVSIVDGTARLVGSDESEMVKGIGNMILANFQDMPPETLAMLQTASAIGSSFRLSWMRDLAGLADPEKTMEPALRAGILTVHSVHSGGGSLQKEARFVHDMAREVLYESLLLVRRTKLHSNIAIYLERNAGKTETELPALLSVQFEKAGDTGRAARYALQTADSYKADYDYASARENWVRFLLLIGFTLPEKVLHDEIEGEYEKDGNNEKVEEEAAPWGDRKTSASLLGADGAALVTGALRALSEQARSDDRGEASLLLLKQALLWVSALKDRLELRLSMADVMRENGLYDQAVSLLADIEPRLGNDTGMHGRLLLSRCTLFRLKMDPGALEAAKSAERILKKVKDYRGLTETMSQMAGIHFSRGEPARAKQVLTRAIGYAERSRDLGAIARISGNLGVLHLAEGDMASARLVFAKAVEMAGKVGNLHSLLSSQINLGILLMEQGRFERAETLLTEVSERAERASLKYQECLAWLNLADLSSEYGQINLARERYARAETLAGTLSLACEGALCQVGRAHVLLLAYDPEMDASVDLPVVVAQACAGSVNVLIEAAFLLEIALPILKEAGESVGMSDCLRFQAEVAMRKAIAEKVESLHSGFSTSGAVPQQSGNDATGAANLFSGIGTSPSVHLKEAAVLAESALQIATEAGNGMRRVKALRLLGMLDELNGRLESANERTESSVREAERLESDLEAAKSAYRLSKLHLAAGNAPIASEWLQRARDHAFNVDTCPLRERIMNLV
jgi:tetratricopeptide (TPR) repeat protein